MHWATYIQEHRQYLPNMKFADTMNHRIIYQRTEKQSLKL